MSSVCFFIIQLLAALTETEAEEIERGFKQIFGEDF